MLPDVDSVIERCDSNILENALSLVFRRLLANLLLHPENPKFRTVRSSNDVITNATRGLPRSVVELFFQVMGFQLDPTHDSGSVYIFCGEKESLQDANHFFSLLEHKLEEKKGIASQIPFPSLRAYNEIHQHAQKEVLSENPKRNVPKERNEFNLKNSISMNNVFDTSDFSSVEHLRETARMTLLNTGRVRNTLFEGRHFALRRMLHGRVFVCKESCKEEYLEAHWHLFSGKNVIYAYVAHLTPDASSMVHLGIEHGYQYNSLPGTENFGKTVHFTAKRIDEESGKIIYLEHPNRPTDSCIYCGVSFFQLFL